MKKGARIFIFCLVLLLFTSLITKGEDLTGKAITGKQITGEASSQETNVSVFVLSSNIYPLFGNINSSIFVCEGDFLEYNFNASDPNNDTLTLTLSPENPFFISYPQIFTSQINITSSIISGTLSKTNAGGIDGGSNTFEETISINDGFNATCCTNSTQINITVIEINNAPVMQNIGVQTIWTGGINSTFYKEVQTTDTEEGTQTSPGLLFNVSFSGAHLFDITSEGIINFTPTIPQMGTHNVTICVNDTGIENPHENISLLCSQDGSSTFTCQNFSLTITQENRAPEITNYTPTNLNQSTSGDSGLTFSITKSDPDGTIPDGYWYVDTLFQEYDTGSAIDSFSYLFGCGISGNHTIKAEITDGAQNDSITWNIEVSEIACATEDTGGGGEGGISKSFLKNFTLSREDINLTLRPGKSKVEDVIVTNHEETNLSITIYPVGIIDFTEIIPETIVLNPGESKRIILNFEVPGDAEAALHTGSIVFNAEGTKKEVLTTIEIETKLPLFDVRVDILPESFPIKPGKEFTANISVYNLGALGTYDITLRYLIQDESGNHILFEEENITVSGRTTNFLKDLTIPENTPLGKYILYIQVIYNEEVGSSSIWFSAKEEASFQLKKSIILIAIIVFTLFIIAIKLLKKEEKEQTQNYN